MGATRIRRQNRWDKMRMLSESMESQFPFIHRVTAERPVRGEGRKFVKSLKENKFDIFGFDFKKIKGSRASRGERKHAREEKVLKRGNVSQQQKRITTRAAHKAHLQSQHYMRFGRTIEVVGVPMAITKRVHRLIWRELPPQEMEKLVRACYALYAFKPRLEKTARNDSSSLKKMAEKWFEIIYARKPGALIEIHHIIGEQRAAAFLAEFILESFFKRAKKK